MARREMTTQQLSEWFEQQQQDAELKRQANLQAAALIHMFRIEPNGIDLVCWLAGTSCRDNEGATRYWVYKQLKNGASAGDDLTFQTLVSRLLRRLDEITLSYPI